jgi:hypothetical protein
MMNGGNAGPTYTVALTSATLSTANAWDVLQVTADSSARLELLGFDLVIASTQLTTGSGLTLQLLHGSTAGSTGAAITPRNTKRWTGHATPAFAAAGPSSGLTSTASAVLLWTGAFDFNGRCTYRSDNRDERIVLGLGSRLNFRASNPQIPAVVTGTIWLSETGKALPT